jgi:hypothetical protein
MIDQNPGSEGLYMRYMTGFWLSRAVWLAARFRLADAIGAGHASAAEIARATGTHPEPMRRLLDALTAAGLFRPEGAGATG